MALLIFKKVDEETPPTGKELVVKSPNGSLYIASWRPSYRIFTCQEKGEDSFDWSWMEV